MSSPRNNQGKLTPAQRRQIIDRLEQGENMAALGREFGVTRSAIYELRKRYRERGEAAIEGAPGSGRGPDPKLKKVHEDYLRELFANPMPPVTDPALANRGNATKAQTAIRRKFGFKPSAEECARVLKKLGLSHRLLPSRFVEYDGSFPDGFAKWRESNAARQLARRERSYLNKRANIDVPKRPGCPPLADRQWTNTLRLFQIDDPLLLQSRDLALVLDKITSAKFSHRNSPS